MSRWRTWSLVGAAGVLLVVIAWASPDPGRLTDRDLYEATAAHRVVPACAELHCFRVLVAWVLGALPGPSEWKWKLYAAVANLVAGMAVVRLAAVWGLSPRGAAMAGTLSAFGFGALYTLHDPFTSDPLMYAIGPIILLLLWRERVVAAGLVGAIGVFAKEFAAAPLFAVAAAAALGRRWWLAGRVLAAAMAVFIVWLTLQVTLIVVYDYRYGANASTDLLGGGYLRQWIETQSVAGIVAAMINEFGMLWLLAPAGLYFAPVGLKRLVVASLPIAALFAYVQQPDRALWNFHYLVSPLAALVLERAARPLAWMAVGVFVLANLRVGAQLPWVPPARYAMAASAALAAAALIQAFGPAWRARREPVALPS